MSQQIVAQTPNGVQTLNGVIASSAPEAFPSGDSWLSIVHSGADPMIFVACAVIIAALAVFWRCKLFRASGDLRRVKEELARELALREDALRRSERLGREHELRALESAAQNAESRERFEALMSISPQVVWTASPTGEFCEDCPGWTAFTGQTSEEARGDGWRDAIHPDDVEQAVAQWRQAVEARQPYSARCRMRHVSSQWRWMSSKAVPLFDASGELREWVGASTDITEQEEAREALERLNAALQEKVAEGAAQLERAQQLEALGWLTAGVAHDFNNLLSVILGNMQLLQKRADGDARSDRLIRNAIDGAERGAKLTQLMLTFARRRQESRGDTANFTEVTQGLMTVLRSSLGAGVQIRLSIPDELWIARCDPNLLEMALVNLAVNARDAMPSGGTLTLSARNDHVPETFEDLAAGDYVRITVSDTGVGMEPEILARATEPFFTTKDAGKGAGLGLCMVQDMAGRAGGALRLSSTPGEGSTVKLWLPRAHAASDGEMEKTLAAEELPRQITVLVVDDDALICMATADMLTDMGFTVIEANSGYRALEVLKATPEIGVVVADHAMPGMTGLRLAREIRAGWPKLPILMASGFAELSDGEDLDLPRLSKPYDQRTLVNKINELLAA